MDQHRNPWISAVEPAVPQVRDDLKTASLPKLTGPSQPQKGITAPDAADRLPRCRMAASSTLWVIGVHGGAGETTVSRLIPGSRPTQHAWPETEPPAPVAHALLVCRSDRHGLEMARKALIEWASPLSPRLELLGLAVLADAPGKLPRSLQDLLGIIGGGAPRLWFLPWVEAWRTNHVDPTEDVPRPTRKFITEVNSLLT